MERTRRTALRAALVPSWVTGYERSWLRPDLIAGVTVTAYLVPQVMAYAELVGLPAVVGLWASLGALAGYAFLGSSRQLSVGPESTTALMTASVLVSVPTAAADPATFAAALAVVVAVLCALGWVAHLGALADLLSRPVLVGYLAGVAVIIVVAQVGRLTGISGIGGSVGNTLTGLVRHRSELDAATCLLGFGTLVVLIVASHRFRGSPVTLITMVLATGLSVALGLSDLGVEVVGPLPSGLPRPGLPQLDPGAWGPLLVPALGVAFVGYTDNILTGRAFAARHGERVNARREWLALGAANLGAGLLHGFPVSSSGTRTAIADAAGARSQLSSLVTLATTALALIFLRPAFEVVPIAVLGAVVVNAALQLVDVKEFRRFARFRRSELFIALATTGVVVVVGVLAGVVAAIALSVLDLLRRVARPHDAVEGFVSGVAGMHDVDDYPDAYLVPGLMIYRYDSPLFFANADNFGDRARAAVEASPQPVLWFVLNSEAIVEVDITAIDALESLRAELAERGVVFAIARLKQDLREQLAPSGILDRIGADHLFPTLPTVVDAFRRAHPSSEPPMNRGEE